MALVRLCGIIVRVTIGEHLSGMTRAASSSTITPPPMAAVLLLLLLWPRLPESLLLDRMNRSRPWRNQPV